MNEPQSTNPHLFSAALPGGPALHGTRCRGCGRYTLMHVPLCPLCFSRNVEHVAIGRHAMLQRWSVVHHGADGFPAPYIIAEVQTEEGPVAFAPLLADPQRLVKGARLALHLRPVGDGERTGFAYRLEEETAR